MQTIQSTHPVQTHSKQGNGLFLVCLLSIGAFLFYAVQSHLITDAFVAIISLFFDKFSVKSTSTSADIALLIFFAVFTVGAVDILKNHFRVLIAVAVIAVIVAVAK